MDYIELNHSRRSHRDYDAAFKVDRPTIERLLGQAALAPSSYNMQGYRTIVLLSAVEKQRLHPVAMKQPQVLSSSAMIIVLGNLEAYKGLRHVMEQTPGVSAEAIAGATHHAASSYQENLQLARDEAIRSGSLFAMNFMMAATNAGFETGPMIGFDAAGVCREFNVNHPYFPMMMISLGKATTVAGPRGFRFPADEFADFR